MSSKLNSRERRRLQQKRALQTAEHWTRQELRHKRDGDRLAVLYLIGMCLSMIEETGMKEGDIEKIANNFIGEKLPDIHAGRTLNSMIKELEEKTGSTFAWGDGVTGEPVPITDAPDTVMRTFDPRKDGSLLERYLNGGL